MNQVMDAIDAWEPTAGEANHSHYRAMMASVATVGDLTDIFATLMTYVSRTVKFDGEGEWVQTEWPTEFGPRPQWTVIDMLQDWQIQSDPMSDLTHRVTMAVSVDMTLGINLVRQLIWTMLDLAGAVRTGQARIAVVGENGVTVLA